MSNKAYVGTDGTILGGTDGQILTAHTGNDEPATFETAGGGGGNVTTAGLTTNAVPVASGVSSLVNSIITTGSNTVTITGPANAGVVEVIQPTTAGYASFTDYKNSANSSNMYVGLDGTGLGQVPAGYAVIASTGFSDKIYQAINGVAIANTNANGINMEPSKSLTFNGGANFTYAEGTFLPVIWNITDNGAFSGATYNSGGQQGFWSRSGKTVTISFYINGSVGGVTKNAGLDFTDLTNQVGVFTCNGLANMSASASDFNYTVQGISGGALTCQLWSQNSTAFGLSTAVLNGSRVTVESNSWIPTMFSAVVIHGSFTFTL